MQPDSNVAIVTGSATGVGAATAERLAGKGWRVVINYNKSEAEARETQVACAARGVETLLIQGDVANDADCRHLAQAALDAWGRIDALVNNAGVTKFVKYLDLNDLNAADFQRIYSVNVIGAYQMVRACAPAMKRQGKGAVVNVSSVAGITGMGSPLLTRPPKGAQQYDLVCLCPRPEIRVNAICPGFIEGRWLRDGLGEQAYESFRKRYSESVPLASTAQPDDIAETIVWLIEGARLVTGETIMIDAGMHLAMSL
jgi:3-oxoacyl-[acyl-carrier protein] reductase